MKGAVSMMDRSWQAKQDMQTLHDAMKIKKDKKRMKAAKSMMDEMNAAMTAGVPDSVAARRKGK